MAYGYHYGNAAGRNERRSRPRSPDRGPGGRGPADRGLLARDILKSREPAPPRPEEQPHLPPEGAVREERENREPEEVPQDGRRRLPHEFGNLGTRPSTTTERPRWGKGSSGSFGGGGLGAH
ncbi:hypothetical protein GCM10020256_71050 [Streptomyces thermocoprophilus]